MIRKKFRIIFAADQNGEITELLLEEGVYISTRFFKNPGRIYSSYVNTIKMIQPRLRKG